MTLFAIFMLAIALSMDTFAVSVSCAISGRSYDIAKWLRLSFWLAIFQGGMPILGWYSGIIFADYIMQYGGWISFGLLTYIGINMIVDGLKSGANCEVINYNKLSTILKLGIATSIDAFSVGVTFMLIDVDLWVAVAIIAVVTLIAAILGCFLGSLIGNRWGKRANIIGGVILIAIGIKIVIEHTGLLG